MAEGRNAREAAVFVEIGKSAADMHHRQDVCRIFLLQSGKADYDTGNGYRALERGSLLLLNPEEVHRLYLYGEEQEWLSAVFLPPYLERLSSEESRLMDCFFRPGTERMTVLAEKQLSALAVRMEQLGKSIGESGFGSDLLTAAYATEVILMAERLVRENRLHPERTMPQLVQQTMKYVSEHIREPIRVETLSKELYHNRCHVSRVFKEYVGISLQQYIIDRRIGLVMRELQEGRSLTQASEAAGFTNYSNFIRTFTKHVGISPHRYQRQLREGTDSGKYI